ncbi:MAG: HAD family hydrolase [Gammaproteobacteria bacterium]|nr:HAD family hydrolase [Gammaproteobacteria bacterium]
MTLALFDLDHTLLAGDSDYAWGEFLIERGLVDGATFRPANDRYYKQYEAGTLDIYEFLAFSLASLARHDRATLDRLHAEFMQSHILPMIAPGAKALLEKHRTRGDTLVIITATNSFVTGPIARVLGVTHLIATEPEQRDGRYTGGVAGTPCYREGKVERLHAWLKVHPGELNGSHGYSDSHNDLPLLQTVTHPVAVDPDPILRKTAEARGWPIISLR